MQQIRLYTEDNPSIIALQSIPDAPPLMISETPRQAFPLFGVSLPTLMEKEYTVEPHNPVPRIVRYATQFIYRQALSQEGIFRLAGESVRCVTLKDELNQKADTDFLDSENPHNVSSILKMWLRELPEPVMLFKNYEPVLNLCGT
jgi:hypothetical protein